MLYTVIYISKATREISPHDLEHILTCSRANNSGTGVSGMLTYKNEEFMQALEGEKETVLELMARIDQDDRHQDVTILSQKAIPHRYFKNWSMGFEDISDNQQEGQVELNSFAGSSNKQNDTAHNFLKKFYTL